MLCFRTANFNLSGNWLLPFSEEKKGFIVTISIGVWWHNEIADQMILTVH
jgi:hypothetical protein